MMRTGLEGVASFFKDDINFGVVDGKGRQAQTDKARDGSENQGRVSTNGDSSGSNRHEDKFKTDFTRKEAIDDATPTSKIITENLTINRNNEGNEGGTNKPEITGSNTGGTSNSTGGSNTTFANVQGNAFGYGSGEMPRTEGINVGTGNVVTISSNTETVRNKTKEITASNTDEPKTPKVKTNNFTFGKNNNKKE